MSFLPVTRRDMEERGWDSCDFILINGDAYVDHSSFGGAIISRVLEAEGYRVGVISQPDPEDVEAFRLLGKPRLGFLVTAGNMDSMVNRYTVNKRFRSSDAFSPGGSPGKRPDRASIVYTSKAKQAYKGIPVILGGVEASLRRLAHYDYWSDKLRRSILLDAKADLLVYGMGERTVVGIADMLDRNIPVKEILLPGTVVRRSSFPGDLETVEIPSFEEQRQRMEKVAESYRLQNEAQNPFSDRYLVQKTGESWLVQAPPSRPLVREELDRIYALPFERAPHPMYAQDGGVPAFTEVQFSLLSSRGCFGNCSFCALAHHQGQIVHSRSIESLTEEAKILINDPDFKGYIHDVGGPTANFRFPACPKQEKAGPCNDQNCLDPCKNLRADHREYIELLQRLRSLTGIKKVFIRSGIRYDFLLLDSSDAFLEELCRYHISGQLKVAPEHISNRVLEIMGKPPRQVYDDFSRRYREMNQKLGKKQYLVPYFISSHPGSGLKEAIELAEYLRDTGFIPDQVQDFYPTPGTRSTVIYFTGIDPLTGKKVYTAKKGREKARQRALLQYNRPENYSLVREALLEAGRSDLIGEGPRCLISGKEPRRNPKRCPEKGASSGHARTKKRKAAGSLPFKRRNKES